MSVLSTDTIVLRRPPGPGVGARLVVVAVSLGLAAGTLLVTSLAELLASRPGPQLLTRSVDTVIWEAPTPPPPPPPPPPAPEPDPEVKPPIPVEPVLEHTPPPPPRPLQLPVRLDFSLDTGVGDFDLAFDITPGVEPLPATTAQPAPPAPPPPAPDPKSVYELTDLDRPPEPVLQRRPAYPYRARTRGIEGYADVGFIVRPDGTVDEVAALDAEPLGVFDVAAVRAVRRWRFDPGIRDGEPVPVRMHIRIRFELGRH